MKLVQNIHWPRILAEGAVIVISILLAFWIDAWWDRQQDAAQEKVLLPRGCAAFGRGCAPRAA